MNRNRQEKGITLIALVVTIVVLLILAGVSIVVLFGEHGIITVANQAANDHKLAFYMDKFEVVKTSVATQNAGKVPIEKFKDALINEKVVTAEQITGNNTDGYIATPEEDVKITMKQAEDGKNVTIKYELTNENGTTGGGSGEGSGEGGGDNPGGEGTNPDDPQNPTEHVNPTKGTKVEATTEGQTNVEWKETVEDKTLIAKIPVGFSVVKDVGEDINNITNGLVISDVADDDLDNSAGGNQFVWIPVEVDSSGNTPNFVRIEGFQNGARQSSLANCQEAGKEGTTPPIATDESKAMYQSIAENGGFYIARFEAGIPDTDTPSESYYTRPIPDGVKKPVSQKGVSPWNWIAWGEQKGIVRVMDFQEMIRPMEQ